MSLADLQSHGARSLPVVLECAGHRRIEHEPAPPGVPWDVGAVGEATWTGLPLGALLAAAGPAPDACEVVLTGADRGAVTGRPNTVPFARSLPLAKATDGDVLIAWGVDGEPLSDERGGPVRAIVPGWYATDSVKWLVRVEVTCGPFDGYFERDDYRMRVPGGNGIGERMTNLPVHALVTTPAAEETLPDGRVELRGIAWGGQGGVAAVDVRVDGGTWRPAMLRPAEGPWGRTWWSAERTLASGEHVVSVRARDAAGEAQPDAPPPNPDGYANNSVHRVAFRVR